MDFQKILLELLINQYNGSNQGSAPSTQQPTVPPIQPTIEPVQQPIVQPTQQPIVQPVQQPIVQPVQQPIVQPTQQPIVQPVQQPIVQPTAEPTQPTAPVEEWKFTKDMYDSLNNTLVNLTNVIQTNNRNNTAGTEKQEEFFI